MFLNPLLYDSKAKKGPCQSVEFKDQGPTVIDCTVLGVAWGHGGTCTIYYAIPSAQFSSHGVQLYKKDNQTHSRH